MHVEFDHLASGHGGFDFGTRQLPREQRSEGSLGKLVCTRPKTPSNEVDVWDKTRVHRRPIWLQRDGALRLLRLGTLAV